ncbi:hypothetical protein AK830_g4045 [Neonectria ditissima]|uniref:Uncharacterized protein n=1 Tax=Neonectria ditissima TaxID=78410 RepID=A0A0P7BPM9_9HYPO|nr:hypothetical protein AK830_g4045 [Neonectria ditissima]
MASSEPVELAGIDVLDPSHRQAVELALTRLLETEPAKQAFAEIVDGLPTRESYAGFHWPQDGHPTNHHHELCPGVLEKAREFRSTFSATSLSFSLPLLRAFSEATTDSKAFHVRLLELLAVSCHQIAVHLFRLDGTHHPRDYEAWRDEPHERTADASRYPTPFCHSSYLSSEQYPDGTADICGYWAEAKIFGGVVLFNRNEAKTEWPDIYLHGGLLKGPYSLFPPTTEQLDKVTEYLLGEKDSLVEMECPFPIRATKQNRWRWFHWDAAHNHIFRDKYERYISPTRPTVSYRSTMDWPEIADELYLADALHENLEGKPVDKDEVRAAMERLREITPSSPCWSDGGVEARYPWIKDILQ